MSAGATPPPLPTPVDPCWHIVGSGPVALAFALFLVRRGVPAAGLALDPPPDAELPVPAALAARTLAISQGTRQLLERIVALPPAGRIDRVEVSLRGHAGRTRIVAADLGMPALGAVVRYGALTQALRAAARVHRWATPPAPDTLAVLRVHAEGDAGEDADTRDFGQSALLGEVCAPRVPPALHATAFERFTPDGPLALLPLPEPGRWTMVWCDRAERCEARREAGPATLSAALRERFGEALGELALEGPLAVAPLARRARRSVLEGTDVWIGNAAQSLHPVAGQGLNLGLRDAFELADALAPVHLRATPLTQALEGWRRGRRLDRSVTIGLTDLMAASFTWPLARPLQSPLLAALDTIGTLRRPLALHLMFGHR
ncbi:MAG: FAD-dependent monooxygenase [Burkholderiales bacterium]|jgi:2-octaprenyl-6-methoxyphenol hydroxylase